MLRYIISLSPELLNFREKNYIGNTDRQAVHQEDKIIEVQLIFASGRIKSVFGKR